MRKCFRCKRKKPAHLAEENMIHNQAVEAIKQGIELDWAETIDPTSFQVYYYNKKTMETQWERPAELGPAPMATGWYGRGSADGGTVAALIEENNLKYLQRPARKQKEFVDTKNTHLEGANDFNIWYGKYTGDAWDQSLGKDPAPSKCIVANDAGYTKCDGGPPATQHPSKEKGFFCLHFARGMCIKGDDCTFYHRIPTPRDDSATEELVDCFGRQRHAKHRDDMDGVGSFMNPCRTLYVGGLQKSSYKNNGVGTLEEALKRHFIEWGEIEDCKVIHRLSIGFVRYRLRTSSEFAKEAMRNQALDKNEVLQIRWAYDDPNPIAQDANRKADQDIMYALLKAKGLHVDEANIKYPQHYEMPRETKRMRLDNGTDVTEERPDLAYPNTDSQYNNANGNDVDNSRLEPTVSSSSSSSSSPSSSSSSSVSLSNAEGSTWESAIDSKTGAYYYFNRVTGASSWTNPTESKKTPASAEETT